MMRALIFDLDDTLYRERDFVMSGYRAVAQYMSARCRCSFEDAFSCMSRLFDTEGRQSVFAGLLERFPDNSPSIDELVALYRGHQPKISLCTGYRELLKELGRQYRIGVITDGLPYVQEAKVHALGLRDVVDKIIYTWTHGREKQKPHPCSFEMMLESLGADAEDALFIGDSLEKDCRGAHSVGMKFAEVRFPRSRERRCEHEICEGPEFVIETLFQLPSILKNTN